MTAGQRAFAFAAPCRHPTTVPHCHWTAIGAYHLSRYNAACGRWQQWVAPTETALAEAPPRPRA